MSRISQALVLLGLLSFTVPSFAGSKSFLEATSEDSDMIAVLLAKSHNLEAPSRTEEHLNELEAALRPMFTALAKNEKQRLDLPSARYALHRLYEQRHRWSIRGLEPRAAAATKKSEKLEASFRELEGAEEGGLTLRGLAVLAAALEDLIHSEVEKQVTKITGDLFRVRARPDTHLNGNQLRELVDAYMAIYISGASFRNTTRQDIKDDQEFMEEYTKGWDETLQWVRSIASNESRTEEGCRDGFASDGTADRCKLNLNASSRVVRRVVQDYGFFNDGECKKIKSSLLSMEDGRTGRVYLSDFYKAGLNGAWEFNERVDYLRDLGALDESNEEPKVIVPNYVSSWVNCLNPSQFYSVCCRNECEDLMQILEQKIAGPTAHPDKILAILKEQPVVAAGTVLMRRHRLDEIAHRHRGEVPIHGRLFAQWMHHAFPQTCPYPHETGKTNPQTPDEWMQETGQTNARASETEMQEVVSRAKVSASGARARSAEAVEEVYEELPWSDVEELLVVRPHLEPTQAKRSSLQRFIVGIEVVLSIALALSVIWGATHYREFRTSQNRQQKPKAFKCEA